MSSYQTPNRKGVVAPEGGWLERTYYVVDVAFSSTNVVHQAIFFTGFLNGKRGRPGGYNALYNPSYEDENTISSVYYMKVVRPILDENFSPISAEPASLPVEISFPNGEFREIGKASTQEGVELAIGEWALREYRKEVDPSAPHIIQLNAALNLFVSDYGMTGDLWEGLHSDNFEHHIGDSARYRYIINGHGY